MAKVKRTWSIDEKVAILLDIEKIGIVEGCRKHGIYSTTYYDWLKKYRSEGESGLKPNYRKKTDKDMKKLQVENDRLKRLLAEKELELGIKDELLKKKMQQWKNAKQ
ncbi:MAG TPA: transposase [Bacteroidales bacterium]|nr:transposase [Bacteroidales bacterium]